MKIGTPTERLVGERIRL